MKDPKRLLDQMTLEEKAGLLTGDSAWTTTVPPRLGGGSLRMADGPHGLRKTHDTGSMTFDASPATCFPTASSAAATWDTGLLFEMGQAIAMEAAAFGVDIVLGPGVNMKRSPLCGRNFEYLAEDPFLAGRLGAAWIAGLQTKGVGASLKHFAVNNQETRRMSVSAELDERTLREIYLPAFEHAVKAGRPWTVMCSYNRVNGVYASEHRELLTDILRSEWGFDGFVVSDWAAVHDRPEALLAGLDLEMPGPRPRHVRSVVNAVRTETLDEAVVDAAVLRILSTVHRATGEREVEPVDMAAHHALARRVAAAGVVLLTNDGILPLSGRRRIAVIGKAAREPRIQGGGSSQITPTQVDSPISELTRLAGAAEVVFADGYDDGDEVRPDLISEAAAAAAGADVAVLFLGMLMHHETEGADRQSLDLPPQQLTLIDAVCRAQTSTVVVLFTGSAVALSPWIQQPAAVLQAWYAGQAAGGAVADVLLGIVNPSGRLAETFPVRLEDTPAYLDFPGDGDIVRYGERLFIGYRWYDARDLPVAFPFGHGLSYTTFEYRNAHASRASFAASDEITVAVDVVNTGSRSGSEVVQLYVQDVAASVRRPDKELKGFARVWLEPGEARTVHVELDRRAFAYWDPTIGDWLVEPGDFDLLLGSSSRDIRAVITVTVVPEHHRPAALTEMSPLEDWLRDEHGRAAASQLLRSLAPVLGATFGGPAEDLDQLDPHFHRYFQTMPIRGVLEFAAPAGGPDPEAGMRELMSAVNGTSRQRAEDGGPGSSG
jgi:beta-glucosidase